MALYIPRLLITVVTIVSCFKRPCSSMYFPQMYIILSPSTIFPFSSTAIQRSPSPSKAIPNCDPFSTTIFCNCSGCVEPTLSLILIPLGFVAMVLKSSSKSAYNRGINALVAPLAASTDTLIPSKLSGILWAKK